MANNNIVFEKAVGQDYQAVYSLTAARVRWMDQVGIQQWNVTNYLEAYPAAYYEEQQKKSCLYVLKDSDGTVIGGLVLLGQDDRWADRREDAALYIHNLVTAPSEKGAGNIILQEVENLAKKQGVAYLRLDCAVDNAFLNRYYEDHGFQLAGSCSEGLYVGNRREKKIVQKIIIKEADHEA